MTGALAGDPALAAVAAAEQVSVAPISLALPDAARWTTSLTTLGSETAAALRTYAEAAGLALGPDQLALEGYVVPLLGMVKLAGGRWRAVSPTVEWETVDHLSHPTTVARLLASDVPADLRTHDRCRWVAHAHGAFAIEVGEHRALLAGVDLPQPDPRIRRPGAILLGRSLQDLAALLRHLESTAEPPRLRIWGSGLQAATPAPVTESDVILPAAIKTELFQWLDAFWRRRTEARARKLPLRRGLLLVSPPGHGKTQLARHFLTRYPDAPAHLYIPGGRCYEDPFNDLIAEVRQHPEGALVILEDIDRLPEAGGVTPAMLLNCLDGLLELPHPVLWVATANDPTLVERNLLDRPGRFDRVLVVPAPGPAERRAMLARWSPEPLDETVLAAAVTASDGLAGAHLRQAVASAELAALETGGRVADTLPGELDLIRRQHAAARDLARGLRARTGFQEEPHV